MPETHWRTLRVATYNIHRSRGLDRRTDPSRIAEVVASLEADIIALQEVIGPGAEGMGQAEEIAAQLGMTPVMAPVRLLRGRPFGNAIIGRFPVCGHHRHDLTALDGEGRTAQDEVRPGVHHRLEDAPRLPDLDGSRHLVHRQPRDPHPIAPLAGLLLGQPDPA